MAKKQQKPQKKCQNIKCGGIIDAFNTCLTCGEPYKEPKARPEEAKKAGTRVPRPQRDTPDEFKLWQVSADDPETEVVRKRSLMRLESRKIHTAMGLTV